MNNCKLSQRLIHTRDNITRLIVIPVLVMLMHHIWISFLPSQSSDTGKSSNVRTHGCNVNFLIGELRWYDSHNSDNYKCIQIKSQETLAKKAKQSILQSWR